MSSLCLFFQYLVWMTMIISMMMCFVSWILGVQAVAMKDPKMIQVAFNNRFLLCHFVAAVCISYLLVF